MKSTFFALAAMTAAGSASAAVSGYGQCGGGSNYSGEKDCASGFTCQKQNDWYSQCVPGTAAATKAATKAASKPTSAKSSSAAAKTTTASIKPAATTPKASAAKPSRPPLATPLLVACSMLVSTYAKNHPQNVNGIDH
jgi:hypothetical protein